MTGEQNCDLKSVTLADVAAMVAWWKGRAVPAAAPIALDDAEPEFDTVEGFVHIR
jgi:hypothetical protein